MRKPPATFQTFAIAFAISMVVVCVGVSLMVKRLMGLPVAVVR
jgi:hypothetical protein